MAYDDARDMGTLIISALLILALIFAGLWIIYYVSPAHNPQVLFPWFGWSAAAVVLVGLVTYGIRRRRRR